MNGCPRRAQPPRLFPRHASHLIAATSCLIGFGVVRTSAAVIIFSPGEGVKPLAIAPDDPTIQDVIQFTASLDGEWQSNECFAMGAYRGGPVLTIDNATHTISIGFDGLVPEACADVFLPVNGVEGEFGPLAQGEWTLIDPYAGALQFVVIPESPAATLLAGLALLVAITARRIASREPSDQRHSIRPT